MNKLEEYTTPLEAIELLNMNRNTLYMCLNRGFVEAYKENKRWYINISSLNQFKEFKDSGYKDLSKLSESVREKYINHYKYLEHN